MARINPDRSRHTESPSSILGRVQSRADHMALPLASHPIFQLRKAIIIIAIIGVVLCCISCSNYYYYGESLSASVIFLAVSALLCTADLISYAQKKVEHPDEDPEWPTRRWIIVDAVMAVVLQLVFWGAIVDLSFDYEVSTWLIAPVETE